MNTRPPVRTVLAGLVMAALAGASCSNEGGPPEVAATVEGRKIAASDTEALVDAYLQRYKSEPRTEELPRDYLAKQVLVYQIKLTVLEHLAETMGVYGELESSFAEIADLVQPEAYGLMGERKEDFVRELRAARLRKAIAQKLYPQGSVPEEDIRAEYERRGPLLDQTWQATAQVARFGAPEPAGQLRQRVQDGEAFAQAASALGAEAVATVDIKPAATPLPPGTLDAIGKLRPGEVSDAISAGDGWLVALVERRHDMPRLSLQDLRAELTDLVAERQGYERFGEWFGKQLAKARITVDGHYGEWDTEYTTVT